MKGNEYLKKKKRLLGGKCRAKQNQKETDSTC